MHAWGKREGKKRKKKKEEDVLIAEMARDDDEEEDTLFIYVALGLLPFLPFFLLFSSPPSFP